MDNNDEPTSYTYGNPDIGKANTTIADFKTKYKTTASNNSLQLIEDSIILTGVIVADDESGNIYKSLYINDGTGTLYIGINTTGIYAYLPVGQKITIDCCGLYVGGYGKMLELGGYYSGSIGRMHEYLWKAHVKTEGIPNLSYEELTPLEVDETWFKAADIDECPFFVKFTDAQFPDADGYTLYAPEDEADSGNGVDRTLNIGNSTLTFRTSTYANYAADCLPMGSLTMTGILSRYSSTWQFTVRTAEDVQSNDIE